MTRARDSLFGDWRNKGVALFFAVTIWLVVFQAEKQTTNTIAQVYLTPSNDESTIITSMSYQTERDSGARVEFDGRVRLDFSGPRKQIQDLREQLRVTPLKSYPEIEPEQSEWVFTQEEFGFPRDGIQITEIVPPSIRVAQEPLGRRVVKNMADRVRVAEVRDGFEVATKVVRPTEIELSGPASMLPDIVPLVDVNLSYGTDAFEGDVTIKLTETDDERARIIRELVTPNPDVVSVSVRLKPRSESLSVDAVKVTFSVPPFDKPARILVDELTEGMLPLEFFGPKDQISQLDARLREPGFSVTVPVPRFELDFGQTAEFTFTEESLELFDFPEIQMRPHESRRSPKRPWTYRIVVEKKEDP